jgi:anti-sigma factor RsiW
LRLDCKHVWPYLSDYIDDSVTPEERMAIERHLEHCEICSAVLDSMHNILILTADDRVFHLPVGFGERLHARLEEELKKASLPGLLVPDEGDGG